MRIAIHRWSTSRWLTNICLVAALALAGLAAASLGAARLNPAAAVEPDEILQNAVLEARARRLSADLRCLVCQNQSIDDSNAELAKDLRLLVRQRLSEGDSDADVRTFIVARYGEFVLLRPPLSLRTILLWATPFLILALILLTVRRNVKLAAHRSGDVEGLSADEQKRLDSILKRDP